MREKTLVRMGVTPKKAKDAIVIAHNLEEDTIHIEISEEAAFEQTKTAFMKVREYLERRMTTDATKAVSPTFKSTGYSVPSCAATISLSNGELTDHQIKVIMYLLAKTFSEGKSYNKIISTVQ